jgi:hypothetical protein
MSHAATKPAPMSEKRIAAKRLELCTELVGIHKKHETVFARIDEIKAELKTMATDAGANFKETIPGKGTVYVAGEKEGSFKGDFPILQVDAWKGLKSAQQDKLLESGVVKIEAQYGGKYYGAVTVKLF